LEAELERTAFQLEHLAGGLRDPGFLPDVIDEDSGHPAGAGVRLVRTWVPLERVLVFAAGNFPFAFSVCGNDVAASLAAGCAVTVKVHPGHPRLSRMVASIVSGVLDDAGAPANQFAIVESSTEALTMVREAPLGAVAFTGSRRVGLMLLEACAERAVPVPFYGELASVNPVVITPAALRERSQDLAEGLVASFTNGVGQFCTKPGLVFAPQDARFPTQVAAALDPQALPMLEARHADAFRHDVGLLQALGQRLTRPIQPGAGDARVSPEVIRVNAESFLQRADFLTEECFGPVTVIVEYDDVAHLKNCLAKVGGQLVASLHVGASEDAEELRSLIAALAGCAGRIVWNGWPTGVAISAAMTHGGPFPSATSSWTSIGIGSIGRFLRPVTYQGVPAELMTSWSSGLLTTR